jgi:hypothetical protein
MPALAIASLLIGAVTMPLTLPALAAAMAATTASKEARPEMALTIPIGGGR